MKDLFDRNYHPNEHEARIKQRPLGRVSDFVVEQLPLELEAVRGGKSTDDLVQAARVLIPKVPVLSYGTHYYYRSDVAGLDLKMLEAGIVHSDATPPDTLVASVDAFSQGNDQFPGLTYEEIIMVNPTSDRRTFTMGEVGSSEADFYEGHRRIETHLAQAISTVELGIQALASGSGDVEDIGTTIGSRASHLEEVSEYMHTIGTKMPKEHFAQFRPYFRGHPIRKTRGPSGLFTARVPILELLLAGEQLPEEYIKFLEDNRMYFPRNGRMQMDKAKTMTQEGLTLTVLSKRLGKPEALEAGIALLGKTIRRFRGEHYKGVAHQIPEAISGKTQGTGGEVDPGTFLRERMKIRHTNYEK